MTLRRTEEEEERGCCFFPLTAEGDQARLLAVSKERGEVGR